jgi:hypothetical protein
MTTSSVQQKLSRFVQGGLTEVGPIGLEWWGRFNFPVDEASDVLYTINETTAGRLDKVAYGFYNDPGLWWVIAQYNYLLDPYEEAFIGRVLTIPSNERVQLLLTQKVGGIDSARSSEAILPPLVL